MSRDLSRLLRPKSIAVVGGGAWCKAVVAQCRGMGFAGEVWPVHPNLAEVEGVRAFGTVGDLPGVPDATFIGVNRNATIEVVRALSDMGAGGAVCFASGFREAQAETGDGDALEGALLAAAGVMPIVGPNCYGMINYLDGALLWPDQHGGQRVERGVALITQSSNIAINLTMQTRGLPLAYVVTAGNQAQTSVAEIAMALLEDPRVSALGLHIEGVSDLRGFEALAETARGLGKSIVAVKIGASDQARAATISHTASLAGSEAGGRALLRRLGIGQVGSLAAMVEALKVLHVAGGLPSARVGSMSCSGGEASLMADSAEGSGLTFPALTEVQEGALRRALGPKVALANPLDYHTYIWGDQNALTETFSALMQGELGIGIVVLDFPRPDRCTAEAWDLVIEAVVETKARTGRAMAILASLPENMPEDVAEAMLARGIIPLCGMDEAIAALSVVAGMGRLEAQAPLCLPRGGVGEVLSEAEAKTALAAYGVACPSAVSVESVSEAGAAADRIGYPVVLKGRGIAHKSDAGAVALDLRDRGAVEAAGTGMPVTQFLVEQMIPAGGVELLVGVTCDPAHGYVLTLGAGGVLTEILQDCASLLIPATRGDIEGALAGLRIGPLLVGYRGSKPVDMAALMATIEAVQAYVMQHRPCEIEINPLICLPDAAIAADALIRTGESDDG